MFMITSETEEEEQPKFCIRCHQLPAITDCGHCTSCFMVVAERIINFNKPLAKRGVMVIEKQTNN